MRVLITGAAVRVGRSIAHRYARHMQSEKGGGQLFIHYRRSVTPALELQAAVRGMGVSAELIQADLSKPEDITDLAAAVGPAPLDVLVNSAAQYSAVPFPEITLSQWDAMQAVNVRAPFLLTQALLPQLRAARGLVLNITDIGGERPAPGYAHYSVSKAALVMLTRSLALELAPDVRVNGIAPGSVLPPADLSQADLDRLLATIPMQRFGRPEDVANLAWVLATQAPYVTGQIWSVDGGRSLAGPMMAGG